MSLGHGASIVRDGLVLHLDAAGVKSYPGSGTTWTDLSGNGNDGTLVNGVGYSSDNKGSLSFDGSNDYVTLDRYDSSLNPSFVSVSCWTKFDNVNTSRQLIAKRNTFSQGSYWLYISPTNQIMWDTYQDSVQNRQTQVFSFSSDIWYNISATYSSSEKIIYVNGIAVSSTSGGNELTSVPNDIRIGVDTAAVQYHLNGNISQVSIYNHALTADEIKQNFEATRGRYGI